MDVSDAPHVGVGGSSSKRLTREDEQFPAAAPGEKLLRWVVGSFCVLCVLQASLNVSLHGARCIDRKNQSEATEQWRTTSAGNDSEERDELEQRLTAQLEAFNKEREELKQQLKHYADGRDELEKKLEDFIYYSQQRWVYFSGSFYYISSTTKTWQQSREECLEERADLVVVNSKEEQDFLGRYRQTMWIGLSDREAEGVWTWVDGTPLNTSFWCSGEPNNHRSRDEDCAVMWYYDREDSWNDAECETHNSWICEKPTSP